MTDPATDPAAALVTRLVGGLADLGLRHAVLCPGSRNTPLALALAAEPRITTWMVHDERSAGFVALGAAKSLRLPVAVATTSGTAAAHLHPAVLEARHARVPLLLLTADRPPELRGVGAPQTVDQLHLFGAAVKAFHDTGVPDAAVAAAAPTLALRAWSAALDGPPGPVHLNLPFREPLTIPTEPAPPTDLHHVPGMAALEGDALAELAGRLSGRRVLVVAGGRQRRGFAAAAALLAAEARLPVAADLQCRVPSSLSVAHADLLASAGVLDRLRPEVVLRLGALPTSKPLWRWMADSGVEQVLVDDGDWRDPLGSARSTYRADPAITLARLAELIDPAPEGWLEAWREVDATAGRALAEALAREPFPNEPAVARIVWRAAPPGALYVASSMPVRDVDAFAAPHRHDLEVLANRGVNGIDGLVSAAAGAAAVSGRITVLTGDLSLLHDATSLGVLARYRLAVTLVVLDNDGGGIFHFLPQAAELESARFEELFGAPHGHDLVGVARAFGVPAYRVEDAAELRARVAEPPEGPSLVVVPTDRRENRAVHDRLRAAVTAVLR